MQPAVVTFRPDNFLTVGLIGAVLYVAAVLVTQLLMRAGWVRGTSPASPASSGQVAAA
jgi:hypothetical protein